LLAIFFHILWKCCNPIPPIIDHLQNQRTSQHKCWSCKLYRHAYMVLLQNEITLR
jgi:hypothetical protein